MHIVMDFFSGSATTAHAVMQLNAEDGGHRKFIMVQLPKSVTKSSEAYKAGYKNICEIGQERIRRAGEKILKEQLANNNSTLDSPNSKLDIGFRVLKVGFHQHEGRLLRALMITIRDFCSMGWNPTSRMTAPTSTCCSAA